MATQLEVILSELVAVQAAKDKASADNMVLQKTLISTRQELKDQAATHDARLQKQASRLHADIARPTEQLYAAQGAAETVKAHNEDLQQQLAAMERAQPAASPEKAEAQAQCVMPEAMPTEAAQLSVDAETPAAAEEKIQQLEDCVVTLDARNHYLERVVARQEAALEQTRQELHTAKLLPRIPLGTTVELSGSGQLGVGGRGTVCEVIVEFSAAAKIPKQSGIAQAELANEAAALTAIGPHPNIIEAHGWAYAPQWQTDVLLLELAHDSLFNQIWGTPPYLTSQTLIEETEQGVHDDVHAVCVTAYDLMCGQAMFDALDDKYQSLSDNVRKGCEAFCQRKLACSAEEVDEGQLLAAAEIHGLIAIEEVVPAVDGLPQELLDAILLGITNPWALSLTRLGTSWMRRSRPAQRTAQELASGPEIYIQVDTCIQGDTAAEYIPLSEKEDDSSTQATCSADGTSALRTAAALRQMADTSSGPSGAMQA
ncbi:hypothetical protein WJX75_001753 [Coccomyxa subellipsoidea]|uniref:Protein kinase domain-containing protein n=1 Tax=Coccomyxa subellipsoidea TaxID=248742 RepID=A0ABR2YN58_9CHLO